MAGGTIHAFSYKVQACSIPVSKMPQLIAAKDLQMHLHKYLSWVLFSLTPPTQDVATNFDTSPSIATSIDTPLVPVSTIQSSILPDTPTSKQSIVTAANVVSTSSPSMSALSAASLSITASVTTAASHKENIVNATAIPATESVVVPSNAKVAEQPSKSLGATGDPDSDASSQASKTSNVDTALPTTSETASESPHLVSESKESNDQPKETCDPVSKASVSDATQSLKLSADNSSDAPGNIVEEVKAQSPLAGEESTEVTETKHQLQETTKFPSDYLDYFNPKFMFKEYNLRRTRKPPPAIDMPPAKKQKKDTAQCNLSVSKETKSDSDSKVVATHKEKPKQLGNRKQGNRSSEEPCPGSPDIKRAKLDLDTKNAAMAEKAKHESPKDSDKKHHPSLEIEIALTKITTSPKSEESPTKQEGSSTKGIKVAEVIVRKEPDTIEDSEKREEQIISEEKPTSKHAARRKKSSPVKRSRKRQQSAVSEPNKDENVGEALLCALCRHRANIANLGFLFGPYKQKGVSASSVENGESVDSSSAGNNIVNTKLVDSISTNQEESTVSFWVHEDCVVWAPGACLVNNQLMGLEEAVKEARSMVCRMHIQFCSVLRWHYFRIDKLLYSVYHLLCSLFIGM